MPEKFRFVQPVIIVGTPRSGTSLLHRILRAQPGFVSLASESADVWRKYTHPALNDWSEEGWIQSSLTEEQISDIHRRLAERALGANVWRRIDKLRVGQHQHRHDIIRRLVRVGYSLVAKIRTTVPSGTLGRLVEKSVHNALWLDLIDRVFPDALYVHIVRHPEDNVRSMVQAWLHPDRFFTYNPPIPLHIPDYPWQLWNFGLPPGWQDLVDQPLAKVVANQWAALQVRSIQFFRQYPNRFLRIRLEDLVSNPKIQLERVSTFLHIPWNLELEAFSYSLPRVNATDSEMKNTRITSHVSDRAINSSLKPFADLIRSIGY